MNREKRKELMLVITSISTAMLFLLLGSIFPTLIAQFRTINNSTVVDAAVAGDVRTSGNKLVLANGSRFIVKGVNLEFYRDSGCRFVTEKGWEQRNQIVQKMKSIGINAVRFNYKASWLSESQTNFDQFVSFMKLFSDNGIYVMPSDHSFTGRELVDYESTSFPLFRKIIAAARSQGFENKLIMNPYNEPYGQNWNYSNEVPEWTKWVEANKKTLDDIRKTTGFSGLVILDTAVWAAGQHLESQQSIVGYDATLLGGTPNVGFSNHWYPNINISNIDKQIEIGKTVPVVIGEIGQYNATPLNPQYVKDVLTKVINPGIPSGHNGVFPWMWNWCDSNSMTAAWDNHVDLHDHGQIYVDFYYSKVSSGTEPTIAPTTPTPTRSGTPTSTTAPSPSVTRSPTTQPSPTRTVTPTPPPAVSGSFYRGINLGGPSLTINGNNWVGQQDASITMIGSSMSNTWMTLNPSTTNDLSSMLKDWVQHWSHSITVRNIERGSYQVFVYASMDWNDPNRKAFSVSVNGQPLGDWTPGEAGSWAKIGPWSGSVDSGSLLITTEGMANLAGIEIHKASEINADINGDGNVNIFDLGILATHYGKTINSTSTAQEKASDVNADGVVNVFDLGLVIQRYS